MVTWPLAVAMLTMSVAILALSSMPSWHAQRRFCIFSLHFLVWLEVVDY